MNYGTLVTYVTVSVQSDLTLSKL